VRKARFAEEGMVAMITPVSIPKAGERLPNKRHEAVRARAVGAVRVRKSRTQVTLLQVSLRMSPAETRSITHLMVRRLCKM
jgi:hypothetical protein